MAAKKNFEVKPLAYPKTATPARPASRRRAVVAVGNADRRVDAPAPDQQPPQITGRYERDDSLATLQLNQAGDFIVCWHVDYVTKVLTKFEGDRLSPQSFQLRPEFSSKQVGQVFDTGIKNELLFNATGTPFRFRKVEAGPTLSESDFVLLPAEAVPITVKHQHFPLTFADRKRIRDALAPSIMIPMIEAVLSGPSGTDAVGRLQRGQLAEVIDNYVGALFKSIHPGDFLLADEFAQQLLLAAKMTHDGDTRSILDFLQDITTRSEQERNGTVGQMESLEQHLKLQAIPTTSHVYRATLNALGASGSFVIGGFGGFLCSLDIEEIDPNTATANVPTVIRSVGSFSAVMGSVSLGKGVGVTIGSSSSGIGRCPYVWNARNVPGSFSLLDLSGGASVPINAQTSFSVSAGLFIQGNGEFPELEFDFSGPSFLIGFAAGLGFTASGGYITSDPNAQDRAVPGSHRIDQDYTAANHLEAKVHFEFGSAILTPDAREVLRIMCANELVAFGSAGSTLVITSHADRVDTDQRNLDLSKMRAQNTLQAIQDILGPNFRVPSANITLLGLGEQGAKAAGNADHTKNPAQRKSDVVLNSRLVATLFGRQ